MDCSNTIESPCKCPHHETFDDFSLDCRLDCPSIYNTYSTIRYGNPEQCSCNYPFEWNIEVGDCSYIDCSFIDHTLPTKLSQSCICQQFYVWNDSSLTCKANSTSSTFSPDSSGPPSIGLIIALIFVGLVVISNTSNSQFRQQYFMLKNIVRAPRIIQNNSSFQRNMNSTIQLHAL